MKTAEEQVRELRQHPLVKNWKRGDPYPDLELPDGYGFSYNMLSDRLIIMHSTSIGRVHLDPKYETYHCM